MNTVLVCTAKNEDNYIDEWINYHLKLGINQIFIYENQWNYNGKFKNDKRVQVLYLQNTTPQCQAFTHFIKHVYNYFDYGIFLDCDEFICLKQHKNIVDFLNNYLDVYGLGISTIKFGDSFLDFKEGDYSCINRFIYREELPLREIKTFLNFNICKNEPIFNCPHSIIQTNKIINANKTHYINGPFNEQSLDEIKLIQINHYVTKTLEEYKTKLITRGWPDRPDRVYTDKDVEKITDEFYNFHNARKANQVKDLLVKEFYNNEN